jgi:hypothetical protein
MIAAIALQKSRDASPASANRYLALLRVILRKAALEWEWIDRVPKVKLFLEPRRRIRWLTPEQALDVSLNQVAQQVLQRQVGLVVRARVERAQAEAWWVTAAPRSGARV